MAKRMRERLHKRIAFWLSDYQYGCIARASKRSETFLRRAYPIHADTAETED